MEVIKRKLPEAVSGGIFDAVGRYNLHTHTFRCNHASGDIPELIEAAKGSGYTTLGISEHTILNDGTWPEVRMNEGNIDEYFSTIEKYRLIESEKPDGIRLFSGLECEPLERYFGFYRELKDKYGVDFLLAGNHFFLYKGELVSAFSDRYDNQQKIRAYADGLIKGMESGLFFYVAHPDMFMSSKERWDKYTADIMKDLMRASKEYKVPLEINLNGYRKGLVRRGLNLRYQYPVEEFWALAASENVDVVVGVDAHSPRNFAVQYPDFDEMIKKYNFNFLTEQQILDKLK